MKSDSSQISIVSPRPHPTIYGRKLKYVPPNTTPKKAWLETLDTIEDEKLGLLDLHPEIFGTFPRYYNHHAMCFFWFIFMPILVAVINLL